MPSESAAAAVGRIASRIREWLDHGSHAGVRAYTIERIRSSLESVPSRLELCSDLREGLVFDAGCGSAFDSFALADCVGRIYGVDVDRRAIREGRVIAKRAAVPEVTLERRKVEGIALREAPAVVWCNLMSHNAVSRVDLLATLAGCTEPGAWLMYAEACEGYPLLEIRAAVRRRDPAALRVRLCQAFAGVWGAPTFRFFASGTSAPLLEQLGFDVTAISEETIVGGAVITERVWARRRKAGPAHRQRGYWSRDYLDSVEWLSLARRHGLPVDVSDSPVWFTAYASLGAIAQAANVPVSTRTTRARRLLDRAPRPLSARVNWEQIDDIVASWDSP